MSTHYKVLIRGSINQQEILNVLYVSRSDGTDVEESVTAYTELGAALDATVKTPYLQCKTGTYLMSGYSMSIVDQDNKPAGSFTFEYPSVGSGTRAGSPDGAVMGATIALSCTELISGQAERTPKRSYLAVGPIPSEDINADQSISTTMKDLLQSLGDAIADFTAIVGDQAWTVVSSRVGVPNKVGLSALGRVLFATVRPNSTPRRSRSVTPRGS